VFLELHNISEVRKAICTMTSTNHLYLIGSRKLQIIHAQIRINCSLLAERLNKLHVKESPNCHICNVKEDSQHYFIECKIFTKKRKILKDKLTPSNSFYLKCILYGKSGLSYDENVSIIKAVHWHIKGTNTFEI